MTFEQKTRQADRYAEIEAKVFDALRGQHFGKRSLYLAYKKAKDVVSIKLELTPDEWEIALTVISKYVGL